MDASEKYRALGRELRCDMRGDPATPIAGDVSKFVRSACDHGHAGQGDSARRRAVLAEQIRVKIVELEYAALVECGLPEHFGGILNFLKHLFINSWAWMIHASGCYPVIIGVLMSRLKPRPTKPILR